MRSQIPTILKVLRQGLATGLTGLFALSVNASPLTATEHTDPDDILSAARQFLDQFSEEQTTAGYRVIAEPGHLDPRLRLAHCAHPLDLEFSSDPWRTTQPNVQVSCSGERPWRMFLSVSVEIQGNAYVTARPISRGERLVADMIETREVILNAQRRGLVLDATQLIGMEVRRSLNAGTPFSPDLISAPDAVARGDHVIITARSGQFSVSARGVALASAGVGEQVLVENLTSSRRVRGRVTGPGQVEIPM